MKVFLGGTCNNSTWRDELILMLDIEYFNPVVDDWTSECQSEEIRQREMCDIVLYTITPEMIGVYSIAEVVDDSNKRPQKTIFCLLKSSACIQWKKSSPEWKSLLAVADLVKRNGGTVFYDLNDVADYVNEIS